MSMYDVSNIADDCEWPLQLVSIAGNIL